MCVLGPVSAQTQYQKQVLNPDWYQLQKLNDSALLLWGSDATIWQSKASDNAWQRAQVQHHAHIRSVYSDDAAQLVVAVGDAAMILRSSDQGRSWQTLPLPKADVPNDREPQFSSIDGKINTLVAVGSIGAWRSTDAGQTWQRIKSLSPQAQWLQVKRLSSGQWWMLDQQGSLWQSKDDALTWRMLPIKSQGAIDAFSVHAEEQVIALSNGQLLHTRDAGANWRKVWRAARGTFKQVSYDPASQQWMAWGSEGACAARLKSAPQWQDCSTKQNSMISAVAVSPDRSIWLMVGESGLLLRSENSGKAWRAITDTNESVESRHLNSVLWNEAQQGFLVAGQAGLLLSSDKSALQWTVAYTAPQHYTHTISNLPNGKLIASHSYRSLSRSEDGGTNWKSHTFQALYSPAFLFTTTVDPQHNKVVVGGGKASVLLSDDGHRWRQMSEDNNDDYSYALFWPQNSQVYLYGTGGQVMRVSTNNDELQKLRLPSAEPLYTGFVHAQEQSIYLAGDGGVLLQSKDQGLNWQTAQVGTTTWRASVALPENDVMLLAGNQGNVARAQRGADGQWQPWQVQKLPVPAQWQWMLLAAQGKSIWLGGSKGEFWRSDDRGVTWRPHSITGTSSLRRPSYDAKRKQWWLPGRDGQLFMSTDEGQSWQKVATGTQAHLTGVHIDQATGQLLVYGQRIVQMQSRSEVQNVISSGYSSTTPSTD